MVPFEFYLTFTNTQCEDEVTQFRTMSRPK